MNNNMIFKKVLSGVVIGGILASMGGMALADSTDNSDVGSVAGNRPAIREGIHSRNDGQRGFGISSEAVLDELVAQGLLTQSEADQLLALQSEKAEERKAKMEELKNMTAEERKALREENKEAVKPEKRQDLFSEAVEAGILTQDEVDAIQQKMQESRKAEMQEKQDEIFDTLVDQETITQAQADTIQAYLEEQAANRKAEFEKIKDLSREERKEYLEDNKESKKGLLSELVEEGTITQEQADEIVKLLHKGRP